MTDQNPARTPESILAETEWPNSALAEGLRQAIAERDEALARCVMGDSARRAYPKLEEELGRMGVKLAKAEAERDENHDLGSKLMLQLGAAIAERDEARKQTGHLLYAVSHMADAVDRGEKAEAELRSLRVEDGTYELAKVRSAWQSLMSEEGAWGAISHWNCATILNDILGDGNERSRARN